MLYHYHPLDQTQGKKEWKRYIETVFIRRILLMEKEICYLHNFAVVGVELDTRYVIVIE